MPQLQRTAENVMRAVGGGLILGIPLLYTMDVWWLGETATPADGHLQAVGTDDAGRRQ